MVDFRRPGSDRGCVGGDRPTRSSSPSNPSRRARTWAWPSSPSCRPRRLRPEIYGAAPVADRRRLGLGAGDDRGVGHHDRHADPVADRPVAIRVGGGQSGAGETRSRDPGIARPRVDVDGIGARRASGDRASVRRDRHGGAEVVGRSVGQDRRLGASTPGAAGRREHVDRARGQVHGQGCGPGHDRVANDRDAGNRARRRALARMPSGRPARRRSPSRPPAR